MNLEARAAEACADYEHWAAEVQRLTKAIGETYCPKEPMPDKETGLMDDREGESCFTKARQETTDADSWMPGHGGDRPLNLEEIEEEVADCESCSRLVRLIRERKEARKMYGVAKRGVRAAGKKILSLREKEG